MYGLRLRRFCDVYVVVVVVLVVVVLIINMRIGWQAHSLWRM
jgi:vancomycin permeability regulator SanA